MKKYINKPALVLLSGGLDSAVTLGFAIKEGYIPHTLTFDYHQRHRLEIVRAGTISRRMGAVFHTLFPIDLGMIGGSALTEDIGMPEEVKKGEIPITYVPARNLIFLSIGVAIAEVRGIRDIFYGANVLDYSNYPDCRPEFVSAFERVANAGTAAGVKGEEFTIHAPLSGMKKQEIIRAGLECGVPLELTLSCYDPTENGVACGLCPSCKIRLKGFGEAGLKDPATYRERG